MDQRYVKTLSYLNFLTIHFKIDTILIAETIFHILNFGSTYFKDL